MKDIRNITWQYLNHLIVKYGRKILLRPNYLISSRAIIENKRLTIGQGALISEFVIIRDSKNSIAIGDNSQIGPFCVFFGGADIVIGSNVMIAPHCVLAAGNHDYKQTAIPMRLAETISAGPIIIEDNAWIGSNVTITDGVRIGRDAVIGANSVVTKNVADFEIFAGAPAKRIGSRLSNNL